jgi:hypothetical protein
MQTKYRNLNFLSYFFFSLLVVENLQIHFIFKFLNFNFWKILPVKTIYFSLSHVFGHDQSFFGGQFWDLAKTGKDHPQED